MSMTNTGQEAVFFLWGQIQSEIHRKKIIEEIKKKALGSLGYDG